MVGKGKILISEPYLGDPNFERTVILLGEDNEDGSFGFVLNKPSPVLVEQVLPDLEGFDQKVFIGGPVANDSLYFINKGDVLVNDSFEIGEGIFWGGNYDHLVELSNLKMVNPEDFVFFLGYSGWSEGQLRAEMEEAAWIIGNTPLKEVFEIVPEKMWQEILKRMGGKYKMYSNFPIDPKLN